MEVQKTIKDPTTAEDVVEEFRDFAAIYDQEVSGENLQGRTIHYPAPARLTKLFLSAAKLKAGDRCLDVATGTGILTQKIKERRSHIHMTGVDISPEMLEQARAKQLLDEIEVVNAEKGLPFATGAFKAVVTCGVFEFIQNERRLVNEMARVTAPGGYLAIAALKSDVLDDIQIPGFTRLGYEEGIGYDIRDAESIEQSDYIFAVYQKNGPA